MLGADGAHVVRELQSKVTSGQIEVYTCIYLYVSMYVCMCLFLCICVCIYVYMLGAYGAHVVRELQSKVTSGQIEVYIYVCMYVCMYVFRYM